MLDEIGFTGLRHIAPAAVVAQLIHTPATASTPQDLSAISAPSRGRMVRIDSSGSNFFNRIFSAIAGNSKN